MAVQTDSPTLGRGNDWNSFYGTEPLQANDPFSPSAFGTLLFSQPDAASALDLLGAAPGGGALTFADIGGTIALDQLPPGSLVTVDSIGEDGLYFFDDSSGLPSLINPDSTVSFISQHIGFSDISGTISLNQFPPGTVISVDSINEDAVYFFDNTLGLPKLINATDLSDFVGLSSLTFADIGGTIELSQFPPGSVAALDSIDEDALYFFDNALFVPKLINAADARNFLLPNQTGQDGKFLQTNAGVLSWAAASGGGVVDGQQLFDDSHILSGDFGTRQLLNSSGAVMADWGADTLSLRGGNVVISAAGTTIRGDSNSIGNFSIGYEHGIGIGLSAIGTDEGIALGPYTTASGFTGVAIGQASVNLPVFYITADGSATVASNGDPFFGSGHPAPNSFYRVGDQVLVMATDGSATTRTTIGTIGTSANIVLADTIPAGNYYLVGCGPNNFGSTPAGAVGLTQGSLAFNFTGDALDNFIQLFASTIDATPTRLCNEGKDLGSTTPSHHNQIRIYTGQVRGFQIHYVALKDDGTTLVEIHKGAIKNVSGTVSLVGSVTTERWADAGASTWTLATTADNTNKLLACTFTGAAASNIRVMGHVKSTEVAWFPAAV